jgi:hypothetical protein
MKRSIVRTICFATLFLALAAGASAQGGGSCWNAGLAGVWGYTETGTVINPTSGSAIPAVAVGTYTFDPVGNFTGTQYSSAGGTVSQDTKRGSYTVNANCTATLTLSVYDQSGTTLLRNSVWEIVLVEYAAEMRGIMTSMRMGPGMSVSVPPIMTMSAQRVFPPDRR